MLNTNCNLQSIIFRFIPLLFSVLQLPCYVGLLNQEIKINFICMKWRIVKDVWNFLLYDMS